MTSSEATIKVPRSCSNRKMVALQATCKLVEEWTAKFNAKVEVMIDEVRDEAEMRHPSVRRSDLGGYVMERRYRVMRGEPNEVKAADDDADKIGAFVHFPVRWQADRLLQRGYSQIAIDEIGVLSDADAHALQQARKDAINAAWSNSPGYED